MDTIADVQVERLDALTMSDADAAALAVVDAAAAAVDAPHCAPTVARSLQLRLRHGWEGYPMDHVFVARVDGEPVGYATVEFAHWDNPDVAAMDLLVHPRARADDTVADSLLQQMVEACHAGGRKQGITDAWRDSWLGAYWERRGWPVASRAAQRRIVLADLDRAGVDRLLTAAEAASPDYDLEVVPLPTPAALVDGLLDVHRAMNDAPLDDLALDDDEWSVERLVASETALANRELRVHRLVARRRADGVVGGYTVVIVDPAAPTWGFQEDTAVVGVHRGHRLGLRLKSAMLRAAGRGRAAAGDDRHLERRVEHAHDRRQRAAGVRRRRPRPGGAEAAGVTAGPPDRAAGLNACLDSTFCVRRDVEEQLRVVTWQQTGAPPRPDAGPAGAGRGGRAGSRRLGRARQPGRRRRGRDRADPAPHG